MKNWKFNLLILVCASTWLAIIFGSIAYSDTLRAIPEPGILLVSLVAGLPVFVAMGVLSYQLHALKNDEYQQHQLRSQMLWASTMAISFTAVMGFAQAYDTVPGNQSFVVTVSAWFAGFLMRGLSSSARL